MPKNILVTSLYKIYGQKGMWNSIDTFEDYKTLTSFCVNSFRKNLKNIDEVVILNGEYDHCQKAFQQTFWKLRDMAGENILYVDSDTLCVQPTEIFSKYDNFMMFNTTDPPTKDSFPLYMSSAVRYYPNNFGKDKWDAFSEEAEKWDLNCWDYEVILYNKMFYSQGFQPVLAPELHFCYFIGGSEHLNPGKTLDEAKIIHFGASRGAKKTLERMKDILKKRS